MAAITTWAAATTGCNQNAGCDGAAYMPEPDDPVITDMQLLGQAPNNPWTVLLALSFESPQGTLGRGDALFFANSSTPAKPLGLDGYFSASDVPLDATSGTLAIPLPFAQVAFDSDAAVHLGTKLIDTNNRATNCFSMELNFQLKQASQ